MKCGALLVALVALSAAPLTTFVFVDVPEGISGPWAARTLLTFTKITGFIGDSMEPILGPDFHVPAIRNLVENAVRLRPPPRFTIDMKVINTTFGGVPVLVYKPTELVPGGAGVIHFHGGGWVFGSAVYETGPWRLAQRLNAVVVAVEYRLAPEFPFPIPLQDCVAATIHFMDEALEYGVDPEKIVLYGDSAGGNLAAAVAISLRNQEFYPLPALQVLVYPPLQAVDFRTPSYLAYRGHALIRRPIMVACWLWYAFGRSDDKDIYVNNGHTSALAKQQFRDAFLRPDDLPDHFRVTDEDLGPGEDTGNATLWRDIEGLFTNPLFSPLLAESLAGLPPSMVVTVEHDVLRDDGVWFAQRLKRDGVATVHKHYSNAFHGIISFRHLKESDDILDDIATFIRNHA